MLNTQQYSTTNFAEQDFQTPLIPADAMIYDWTMTTTQHGIRLGSDMFSNRWCSSKVSCSKPLFSKLLLSRQSQQNLTQQATVQQTFLQQSLAHPSSRATASRKPTPITLSTTWIRMRYSGLQQPGQRTPWSPPDATLSPALLDSSGSLFPTPKHNTEQALHFANTTSQAIHHTEITAQAMQPSAAAAATAAAGEELRIAFSNVEDKAIHLGI
ncbi:hypothetical protein D6D15_09690 [Aureobasidium pullulans]|uniref:Uncharacterized protein n=1 Tax=Aureobasidium pullulans TaxID=5580 RepID=A0A4S9AU54_AURPU|nr:hypothetical protein D6D15_09690 [Aureobasidium pullulans]